MDAVGELHRQCVLARLQGQHHVGLSLAEVQVAVVLGNHAAGRHIRGVDQDVMVARSQRYDLLARLRMVILTSNLPDTRETRNSIAPRVLRALIDERLQLQEAQKLSIGIEDGEVVSSIQTLENQLGLPEGDIKRLLGEASIPYLTLEDQIRAQIAWSKVVRLRLRPTVQVGQGEIETYLTNLKENLGKPE